MKTKQSRTNSKRTLRGIFQRRLRVHDPMLVLNMSSFNFTIGGAASFLVTYMDDSPPDYLAQTMEPALVEMNAARQSVVVRAPVAKVYEQWSRFEDLPKFIKPLRRVQRIDASHFSYTWHPNGEEEQGVFHILLRIPERRIAWRSISDGFISGVVSFERCSNIATEITLKIRSVFDPPRLSRRLEEYLGSFKRLVENEAI